MKKVLALILALVLVLSLAACGGSGEKKENTTETTKAEITTDSLLGEWYRTNDVYSDANDTALARQLLKGGMVKWWPKGKGLPVDWDEAFTSETWELNDDCVTISYQFYGGRVERRVYEIIDENTMKDVSCGAVFKKQ